jgi:CheY-like chemotaxis protein
MFTFPSPTDTASTMTSQHILIVEDNYDLQTMFARGFRRANYEVMVASSGQNALQILQDQRPDLIILDMNMPGMSGLEVLEHIRQAVELRDTKVIMVTGNLMAPNMPETAAADLLLMKPISPLELVRIAQRLL